jgi:hypothetical protein
MAGGLIFDSADGEGRSIVFSLKSAFSAVAENADFSENA